MNHYWQPGSWEGHSELQVTWMATLTRAVYQGARVILRTQDIYDPIPRIWKLRLREVLCPRPQLGTGTPCLELILCLGPILPPLLD